MLYVFTHDGDTKTIACKKAAAAIKSAGALVIDSKADLHEFIGTVTWYDRSGWLVKCCGAKSREKQHHVFSA